MEQDAGLHFLLKVDSAYTDHELTQRLDDAGIRIRTLSDYYHENVHDTGCLVVNYSGLKEERLTQALEALEGQL